MYVDKRLAGIQAVQTLSRLNRCYPGKDNTYVLDFVNDAEEVLAAFKMYYETAELSDATDPNIILDLRTKLDALGYYDDFEIERVVQVVLEPSSKQKQLETAITPVADRLLKRFSAAKVARAEAIESKDDKAAQAAKDTMEALVLFRTDVSTYLRAYTFLSQIFDYGNTDFEKRAIFFKPLVRLLKFGLEREGVDLSEVVLTHHKLHNRGKQNLSLSGEDAPKLNPMTEAGSGEVREKQKAYLTEIIEQLNTLFGGDTTEGDQLSYATTLAEKTLESELLQKQAANNSKEQFANSPDLTSEILNAVMDSMDAQMELSGKALNSADIREGLKRILLNQLGLYEKLRQRAAG
jgi:type I restriction enzyme, R subunit